MRLVYVLPSASFGIHQYTADLANRIAEIHDTFLCTTKQYPSDRYSPRVTAVLPVDLSTTGFSLEGIRIQEAHRFLNQVLKLDPDIVHITGPHLWNPYFIRILRRNGIPVIHTIHDLDPHLGMKFGRLLPTWNRAVLKSANHILVHGNIYRDRLIKKGLSGDQITSIPLLFLFLSYDAQAKIGREGPEVEYGDFFLFFGRFERYKGLDILVKAFRELKNSFKNHPVDNFRLVLAGSGSRSHIGLVEKGEDIEVINELIDDKMASNLFGGCAAVVLPYKDATQSAIIPSAYYFRKPVIATNTGAFGEYVEDHVTGHMVNSGDLLALKNALKAIATDPNSRKMMGNAGRQWYDNRRRQEWSDLLAVYEHEYKN